MGEREGERVVLHASTPGRRAKPGEISGTKLPAPRPQAKPLPDPPPHQNILEEANEIVEERMSQYGPPTANHNVTSRLWSAYLGIPITPEMVCYMMILAKISRTVHGDVKRDTLVDIAGYARNIEIVQDDLGR